MASTLAYDARHHRWSSLCKRLFAQEAANTVREPTKTYQQRRARASLHHVARCTLRHNHRIRPETNDVTENLRHVFTQQHAAVALPGLESSPLRLVPSGTSTSGVSSLWPCSWLSCLSTRRFTKCCRAAVRNRRLFFLLRWHFGSPSYRHEWFDSLIRFVSPHDRYHPPPSAPPRGSGPSMSFSTR